MNIQLNPLNLQRVFHGIRFILRLVKIACREISNFFLCMCIIIFPNLYTQKEPSRFSPISCPAQKSFPDAKHLFSNTKSKMYTINN